MKRFWMVRKPGTSTNYEHPTFAKAVAEAERLHKLCGGDYVILEAVAFVGYETLPRVWSESPAGDEEETDDEKIAVRDGDLPH